VKGFGSRKARETEKEKGLKKLKLMATTTLKEMVKEKQTVMAIKTDLMMVKEISKETDSKILIKINTGD